MKTPCITKGLANGYSKMPAADLLLETAKRCLSDWPTGDDASRSGIEFIITARLEIDLP